MKERLRPGVAPAEVVTLHQLLVKMLGGEAPIACPVKRLHLRLPIDRYALARHFAEPTVQQSRFPLVLEALTPPAKCPLADPKQLRRFQLIELRSLVTAQHVQKLDHPHTLKGF